MSTSAVMPTERLFEQDSYRRSASATVVECSEQGLVLDRTIFYAESGGQPGDQGILRPEGAEPVPITDTQYLPGKLRIRHIPEQPMEIPPGTAVHLEIDWQRRYAHMRMHTCLHVICGLVDAPVTGCSIHAERGRLDLDLPESRFTKEELTERLQRAVAASHPVSANWRSGPELATALDSVRTVKAPPAVTEAVRIISIPGLDTQPCGGTHVRNLSELAGMRVARIQKKSRHARRIQVVPE